MPIRSHRRVRRRFLPTFAITILLPLGRTAYQTNEQIDLSVVRSAPQAQPAAPLTLTVTGDDASKMVFTFPVDAIPLQGGESRATEHLHLNGRLLRPGHYTAVVAVGDDTAKTQFDVCSHIRSSTFKLIDWGSRAAGAEQALLGPDSMGFNLLYPAYGGLSADDIIRGGMDYMWCCTMGGGHQMDLRSECDWSDPYVLQGGEARVVRRAFQDRTNPSCIGVHFYDEPGLTWWKYPKTGVMSPFNIPAQDRAYKSAFGTDAPQYPDVKPDNPAAVARWMQMNRWKESFLDAAWKVSAFGVDYVRPDYLSATQSVYGFSAYADGYYFNVVRSLPVISGHGGYSDWGPGYFNPGWTFEMGRIRDLAKPAWYLPMWSNAMPSDQYRMEDYLSFITNLQGMAKPPDATIQKPSSIPVMADGIVEANKTMARLGTIFTIMPVTRPPVAMLYSLSQNLSAEIKDMQNAKDLNIAAYEGGGYNRDKILLGYLAGKMIHNPVFPIVEEDVLDGTLAAHHKVVFLPGINSLDPKVISALEAFIAGGGTVLVSDDSQVRIQGAKKLGYAMTTEFADRIRKLTKEQQQPAPARPAPLHPSSLIPHPSAAQAELAKIDTVGGYYKAAEPVAKALQARLQELGIRPAFDSDKESLITSRQGQGDIDYLFAVNATYDEQGGKRNSIKAAAATLSCADDGRPIYDAIHGGPASEFKAQDGALKAAFRFGPGQMRAFARTARPIGGVQVATPLVVGDYTVADDPVAVEIAATLVDTQNHILSGSAPLQIRVIDPLGVIRYDLYRATDRGALALRLPLAANDPAGDWKVSVRELLADNEGIATFTYKPAAQCGALAGATARAVTFGRDRENLFRLFHTHSDVTIVKGSSDFDGPAADRLVTILTPWNIHCTVVKADDVNRPRPVSAEEAPTGTGLEPGKLEPGSKNGISQVGFDVRGPVLLVGNPDDNLLIRFALDKGFLPYKPDKADFPGRGRGMLAWQRDAVSYGNESATLIAYDADGMSEAVGSLYEAAAGLDPLTPLVLPATAAVTPATAAPTHAPEPALSWQRVLPDRPLSLKAEPDGKLTIHTEDGSLLTLDDAGKIVSQKIVVTDAATPAYVAAPAPPAEIAKNLMPRHVVKYIVAGNGLTAVAYWGGALQLFDATGAVKAEQELPQDIAGLTWLGKDLVVGEADGRLLALEAK